MGCSTCSKAQLVPGPEESNGGGSVVAVLAGLGLAALLAYAVSKK